MISNQTVFDTWNIIAAITVACLLLSALSAWLQSRAYAMKIAAEALREHFEAVEQVIDDPAVPPRTLKFVSAFSEIVSDGQSSQMFIEIMKKTRREKGRGGSFSDELDLLAKTRPDLVDGVYRAVSKGMVSMLFRQSPSKKQVDEFLLCLATDPKREMHVATKYVASRPKRSSDLIAA